MTEQFAVRSTRELLLDFSLKTYILWMAER